MSWSVDISTKDLRSQNIIRQRLQYRRIPFHLVQVKHPAPNPSVCPWSFGLNMGLVCAGLKWQSPTPAEIKPLDQRKWLVSFAGSLSDGNRQLIYDTAKQLPADVRSRCMFKFIAKSAGVWIEGGNTNNMLSVKKGFLGADEYKQSLLDSRFALVR